MDITNPMVREYLASVMPDRRSELEQLHRYALENNVPIIKHEMEQFLKFVVAMNQPKRILEIGTAIGFSAILMAEASLMAEIITLEKSHQMAKLAVKHFREFGIDDRITLIEGDAVETLKDLRGSFDLIFMDAAKGQYLSYYEESMRLLAKGGVLIADNILQDGLVVKSRFAIPRRQRTIHSRMREFVHMLSEHKELTTVVLPVADGATLSYRKADIERD